MEQEFNDQKHVTSVIVCVWVCLPSLCVQATGNSTNLHKKINRSNFSPILNWWRHDKCIYARNIHMLYKVQCVPRTFPLIEFNLTDLNSEFFVLFHFISFLWFDHSKLPRNLVECNEINDILFFHFEKILDDIEREKDERERILNG